MRRYTVLLAFIALISSQLTSGVALGEDLPLGAEPLPTLSLRWMFYDHTSSEKDQDLYWGPGSKILGVRGNQYGRGTWFAAEGEICYAIKWIEGRSPLQSTSSQGGGFVDPISEIRCSAYQLSSGGIYRRLESGSGKPLSDWGDATLELAGLRPGNLIRDRFAALVAGLPD